MPRYGRLLTDAQREKIRPLLPKRPRHRHGGRPRAPDRKVLEGILWILRSGARCAGFAGRVPASLDLLAAAAGLGRAGCLAEHLARVPERVKRTAAVAVERIVPGRQFCPSEKKGAAEWAKPAGGKARSGWWWSTARVFLWETTFTLPPRRKSGSRKRRWPRSA